jgi:hypothetical protein
MITLQCIILKNKFKENEVGRAYNMYGNDVYKILVAKPEMKGSLGKPRHRLEDNIEMAVKETEREDVDLTSGSRQPSHGLS